MGRHFITSLSFYIFIRNHRGILPVTWGISVTSFGGGVFILSLDFPFCVNDTHLLCLLQCGKCRNIQCLIKLGKFSLMQTSWSTWHMSNVNETNLEQWFSAGEICLPGTFWRCLRTCLLSPSSGRPGTLFCTLQCIGYAPAPRAVVTLATLALRSPGWSWEIRKLRGGKVSWVDLVPSECSSLTPLQWTSSRS